MTGLPSTPISGLRPRVNSTVFWAMYLDSRCSRWLIRVPEPPTRRLPLPFARFSDRSGPEGGRAWDSPPIAIS